MCAVVAVIVSYNPDLEHLALVLDSLVSQVGQIIIINNASVGYVEEWIGTSSIANVECVSMGSNKGVAAALNVGISRAREVGADFVLLMDQDSLPQGAMVAELRTGYKALVARGKQVAAIGPRFLDSESGTVSSHVRFTRWRVRRVACTEEAGPVSVDFLITSGSLIPMSVFEDVGSMDESLFIDHVDTEWVLRARARGYEVFGDCRALMEHSLGECRQRIWFLRWREVPIRKPFRYYYMFRNSVLLYHRWYMVWAWKRVDLVRLVEIAMFTLIFDQQRLTKMRMMWRGLWDGIRGKVGPL